MATSRWLSAALLAAGLATPALGAIDFGGNWVVQQAGVLPFSALGSCFRAARTATRTSSAEMRRLFPEKRSMSGTFKVVGWEEQH